MSQHWEKSQVPYFITIKDHISLQRTTTSSTSSANHNCNNSSQTPQTTTSLLQLGTQSSYPQIKYLFADDPPLSQLLQDQDIILELDATGSQIVSTTMGNGEIYQITGKVNIENAQNTDQLIKGITINRVSSQVDGITDLLKEKSNVNTTVNNNTNNTNTVEKTNGTTAPADDDADFDDLQDLIGIFNKRNELLLGCLK